MKLRVLWSILAIVVLLSGLAAPAAAQGSPQVGAQPEPAAKPAETAPSTPPAASPPGIEGVATDYGWSQSTGTYTEITGGTQLTTSCDDTNYNNNPVPFTFTFNGTGYTAVSVNCNGFLAMGATVVSSYTPISSGTSNNVVVGLGGDQQTNTTNSEIRYETLGTTPNRVFVVQWKNFRHYAATGDIYNYQIRLYETSNVVEVVYGAFTQNATARTSQIGLRGASSADFNNRKGTAAWINSVAGTLNTDTMALTSSYYPPSGLTWTWTPIPPHPIFDTSFKTATRDVVVGDSIAYAVHIINSGTAAATAATMVDPIPAGTSYNGDVVCSAGTCSYNAGLNQVEWAGTLAIGAQVDVTFSVDTDGLNCLDMIANVATMNDPGLFGGPVAKSASTRLVDILPTPLEGFEATVPPPGWTETIINDPGTDPDWSQVNAGTYPTISPHGGGFMAKFNSFNAPNTASARLWTGALDLSSYAAPQVVFWMSHDTGYSSNADLLQMQVSTDGVTWTDFGAPVLRYDASCTTACWQEHSVPLPAGYNINGVYIGFLAVSAFGNNFYLDDVALSEAWYPCAYVGLAPDSSRTVCPGSSVEYVLTLANMTPDGDTFDITVAGNAWPTTPDPAQLVLGPGASGLLTVTVDSFWGGGADTAIVTALGQTYGGTDSATLATTAASTYWDRIPNEPDNGRMDNVAGTYNGLVWSITGYGLNRNVRTYDPATQTWATVGTPPTFTGNYARSGCQAGSKVYMYGDTSTIGFTGLWSYDMSTTTWTQETPGGTPPTYTGIWAPAWAYDEAEGLCYLTGGASVAGAGNLTSVYVYDTVNNTWLNPLPDFTTVRDFHAAWVFTDNTARKLLCVAGGNNGAGLASTQCYDFGAAAWGAEDADMGPLPADLWGMGYTHKVHEGVTQLWVTGGVRAGALTAATSFFDVGAGAWADDGSLPGGAVYRTAAVTLDNELYAVGGSIGSFSYTGLANHHVQCPAVAPDIAVNPDSLEATLAPDQTEVQVLNICNNGDAPLTWELSEMPGRNGPESGTLWDNGVLVKTFVDHTGPTPIAAESNGAYLFTVSGGSSSGDRFARYLPDGTFDAVFAPGIDFRSIDTNNGADLFAKSYPDGFYSLTADGVATYLFALPGVDAQSSAVLNGDDTELYVRYMATVRRHSAADGTYLGEFTLSGMSGGELGYPANVQADTDRTGRLFTYAEGVVSEWDLAGNRIGTSAIPIATPSGFDTTFSFAVDGDGLVYLLNESTWNWEVYDVGVVAVTDIPWLSEAPISGTVAAGDCSPVDVTFDSTGLSDGVYEGELLVGSDDPDTPEVTVPVTLTVITLDPPDIEVSVTELDETLCADSTSVVTFSICNVGEQELDWQMVELPDAVKSVQVAKPARTVTGNGRPVGTPPPLAARAAVPLLGGAVNPDAVLWDQPVGPSGFGGISDYLTDFAGGAFTGDDFQNAYPWQLDTIYVAGFDQAANLARATALDWVLYPDDGGVPAGYPGDGSGLEVWSFSCAPTDPGVTIDGTGLVQNVTLDLVAATGAPLDLPAGHYWLVFYPTLSYGGGGAYYWFFGATANLNHPQLIDPTDLFGGGFTDWTDWVIVGGDPTYTDMAFRLEGQIGADVPWLSEDPVEGTLPGAECVDVEVTFDSTGLTPGEFLAELLILSNDPDEPDVTLPVTLTVLTPVSGVDFDMWPLTPETGETIYFTATVAAGDPPFTFAWDFGDGTTGTGQYVTHVFNTADTYTVTLTVNNECGEDQAEHAVVVAQSKFFVYVPLVYKGYAPAK